MIYITRKVCAVVIHKLRDKLKFKHVGKHSLPTWGTLLSPFLRYEMINCSTQKWLLAKNCTHFRLRAGPFVSMKIFYATTLRFKKLVCSVFFFSDDHPNERAARGRAKKKLSWSHLTGDASWWPTMQNIWYLRILFKLNAIRVYSHWTDNFPNSVGLYPSRLPQQMSCTPLQMLFHHECLASWCEACYCETCPGLNSSTNRYLRKLRKFAKLKGIRIKSPVGLNICEFCENGKNCEVLKFS